MNFIRQREKHNGRLPVKAEAHRGWLHRTAQGHGGAWPKAQGQKGREKRLGLLVREKRVHAHQLGGLEETNVSSPVESVVEPRPTSIVLLLQPRRICLTVPPIYVTLKMLYCVSE